MKLIPRHTRRKVKYISTLSHSHFVGHSSVMTKLREYTDPATYNEHTRRFASEGLPVGQDAWVERAREVASILAQDAAARDIENKSPRAEVALLKAAGLTKVLGPTRFGGGGENWSTAYKVIRSVAAGDGSLGMLLGYHLLWSTTANVVGTDVSCPAANDRTWSNDTHSNKLKTSKRLSFPTTTS